eukprot:s1668_g8.t1
MGLPHFAENLRFGSNLREVSKQKLDSGHPVVYSSDTMVEGRSLRSGEMSLINNDFCEACQSGGRLLLCEHCPRAFHVQCIERLVDLERLKTSEKWLCPVCEYGEGVLRGKHVEEMPEGEMKADLLSFAESFFTSSDFDAQPRSVVDVTLDATAQRLIRGVAENVTGDRGKGGWNMSFKAQAYNSKRPTVKAMAGSNLEKFEEAMSLSSLALGATVAWDDVTDFFDDHPGLLTVLEISADELCQVTRIVRKVMDKAHDRKSDTKRLLAQTVSGSSGSNTEPKC